MKPMSPEDAQLILNGADFSGGYLDIGYRRALETIAGMREEWGVSYREDFGNEGRITWGWKTREEADRFGRFMTGVYVYGTVRRYVTEQEEA